MRYSDDFIVVLPGKNQIDTFKSIIDIINAIPGLKLENRKTQFFQVDTSTVINIGKSFSIDADDSQKKINFLGFSFTPF